MILAGRFAGRWVHATMPLQESLEGERPPQTRFRNDINVSPPCAPLEDCWRLLSVFISCISLLKQVSPTSRYDRAVRFSGRPAKNIRRQHLRFPCEPTLPVNQGPWPFQRLGMEATGRESGLTMTQAALRALEVPFDQLCL